jgi:hypothetical protein
MRYTDQPKTVVTDINAGKAYIISGRTFFVLASNFRKESEGEDGPIYSVLADLKGAVTVVSAADLYALERAPEQDKNEGGFIVVHGPDSGWRYKHFKGGQYRVVSSKVEALVDGEVVTYVAYEAHINPSQHTRWLRPYESFFGDVRIDRKTLQSVPDDAPQDGTVIVHRFDLVSR